MTVRITKALGGSKFLPEDTQPMMGRLPQRLRLVRVWSLCLGASLEGVWWKPEMGVGGLCVLTPDSKLHSLLGREMPIFLSLI